MGDRESDNDIGRLKRALTERLLAGRLPGALARWVHRRMRRDPAWAAHYDVHRRVERAAAGGPSLSGAQKDLVKRMLFAGPLEAPAEDGASQPASSRGWLLGASVAAAAAVVVLVVVTRPAPLGPEGAVWTPRGASSAGLGFRVRCVAPDRQRVLAEAEAGTRAALGPTTLTCPADGLLAFSATNLSEEDAFFFVVGVGEDGAPRWYAPFDEGASSVPVAAGVVDDVMDALAGLRRMEGDRHVALFALFSPRALSADEVARAVATAKREGLSLSALSRLPLSSSAQARVDLHREGGG